MLVSGREILQAARNGGYAVGAFNLNNMEILQAIVEAAEEERSPVIIQASQGALKYAGIEYIAGLARIAAEKATVPVALNLDHGTSFHMVQCIRHGFTAVMIDGSKLPFEENIAIVQKVVEVAHPNNVSVEAELGKIGGVEDDIVVSDREATFTDPDEAAEFAERTKCDALAIAIGTAHGLYKGEPKLDFERLREIRRRRMCRWYSTVHQAYRIMPLPSPANTYRKSTLTPNCGSHSPRPSWTISRNTPTRLTHAGS